MHGRTRIRSRQPNRSPNTIRRNHSSSRRRRGSPEREDARRLPLAVVELAKRRRALGPVVVNFERQLRAPR